MDHELTIRQMQRHELDFAVNLAANEGWNPGVDDAKCFWSQDQTGFLIGLLNDKPIGCISAVSYNGFGFIGFYIVQPQHRGEGHGLKLWNMAMNRLKDKNIGLDGVVAQQDNYKKSGFVLAHNNTRYQGQAPKTKSGPNLAQVTDHDFDQIQGYDLKCFPSPRPNFLRSWLTMEHSQAYMLSDSNKLAGYGVIRKCGTGHKIGPLFANSFSQAKELLHGLLSHIPGEIFFLDTPETNPQAVQLAQDLKMEPVFKTARMYTGPEPEIDMDKVFGITTFELG